MASSPTPDTRDTEPSSAEKTPQTYQQVHQPTGGAISVKSFEYDSSEAEAASLALGNLSERFQQCRDDVAQGYHRGFERILEFKDGSPITQCISLGLGNFDEGDPQSGTSLHQLAVLTVLLQILADRHNIQKIYFQDPVFTEVERAFLRSLGYTVLEDPAACEKMSAETFLFAPFLPYDVAASALMVAFPALYIGNSPAKYLNSLRSFKYTGPEIPEMMGTFERFQYAVVNGEPLPSFDQQSWTRNTIVHWRVPSVAGPTEHKKLHSGTEHKTG